MSALTVYATLLFMSSGDIEAIGTSEWIAKLSIAEDRARAHDCIGYYKIHKVREEIARKLCKTPFDGGEEQNK